MTELTDDKWTAATLRGEEILRTQPLARSVRYDRRRKRIIVELTNGCTFAFPPRLGQGLAGASEDDLAKVEVAGIGYGLRWERLDVDLSVKGLMAGIFGTKSWMAQLGGRSKSPAKAVAARANGRKGGRPRKTG